MPRPNGSRLTDGARARAVRSLEHLIAAGVSDDEARDQIAERFNVTSRTARFWLELAYKAMARDVEVDRKQQVATALRRRRLVMAHAAKAGDWKTYLAAAESEAKLLGLNAPIQTEHLVLVEQARGLSTAVVDVVKSFFQDDPAQRARFVDALRRRLNAEVTDRRAKAPIVIDAESEEIARFEGIEIRLPAASEERVVVASADVAPGDAVTQVDLGAKNPAVAPFEATSRATAPPVSESAALSARV